MKLAKNASVWGLVALGALAVLSGGCNERPGDQTRDYQLSDCDTQLEASLVVKRLDESLARLNEAVAQGKLSSSAAAAEVEKVKKDVFATVNDSFKEDLIDFSAKYCQGPSANKATFCSSSRSLQDDIVEIALAYFRARVEMVKTSELKGCVDEDGDRVQCASGMKVEKFPGYGDADLLVNDLERIDVAWKVTNEYAAQTPSGSSLSVNGAFARIRDTKNSGMVIQEAHQAMERIKDSSIAVFTMVECSRQKAFGILFGASSDDGTIADDQRRAAKYLVDSSTDAMAPSGSKAHDATRASDR